MNQDQAKTLQPDASPELTSRRGFLSTLGAAAAGMLALRSASGQNGTPQFQDSFGNVGPAAGDALAAGAYPPPVYNGGSGPAQVTPGYQQPNILFIMVDQLRAPRWLPTGGQAALDALTPNLAFLRDHSFNFPNYFVVATDCTPCRAAIVTGLYSQQTFVLQTQVQPSYPALQTGFPTFGTALSQQAGYATCWIGKWHLSDFSPNNNQNPGSNGPSDYGFNSTNNLPPNSQLASPNGGINEGSDGYNQSPYGSGTPNPPVTLQGLTPPQFPWINDAAIANWFINTWLPNASKTKPWFTAVSFVNPHDITAFPFAFGLSGSGDFGSSKNQNGGSGYQPPLTAGVAFNASQPDQFIPPLNSSLYPANGTPPVGWNMTDDPSKQPYGQTNGTSPGYGKPGLQTYFQGVMNNSLGSVNSQNGWFTFLNYYYWMQSCVDYHIGRVLTSLGSSSFAANTIVMFTADHGDYGGSHYLHTKGMAAYDESINVPFYISFPKMRPPFAPAPTKIVRPYVCSGVDIFPLLYTLALGNNSWRNNASDPYTYLSGREAILDAIFSLAPAQRRLSPFLNASGQGYQPYILHTCDEFASATLNNQPVPSHLIAYRTVDTSVTTNVGGVTFYGGGKLVIYSFWASCATTPDNTKTPQYEFYNYSAGNVAEVGNSAFTSAALQLDVLPSQYLTAYNNAAPNELYIQYSQVQTAATAGKKAYLPDNCS